MLHYWEETLICALVEFEMVHVALFYSLAIVPIMLIGLIECVGKKLRNSHSIR